MATASPVKQSPLNPCCALWKERNAKLQEGRKALRQAIDVLDQQVHKLQSHNLSLTKAFEEEQTRAEAEKQEKEKELALRVRFENEVSALKSELSKLRQNGTPNAENETSEVHVLRSCVSGLEKETHQLKELLDKEKIKTDYEINKAVAEKKSAVEAWKQVEAEKARVNEERKRADIERKNAEEYRLQLEAVIKEADETKSKLVTQATMFEETNRKLEIEKNKVAKERKRADSEKVKVDEQRKLVEAHEKKVIQETARAERLCRQLKEAHQTIEEIQKANEGRQQNGIKGEVVNNYQLQLEALRKEAEEAKLNLVSQTLKFEEAIVKLEATKADVAKEKEGAKIERAKIEEQRCVAERKITEETSRAEDLSRQLEDARQIIEKKERETQKMKLLDKQLKLEKMKLKHTKQVVKLEKSRHNILLQELSRLKLDFGQISCRLDLLDKCFSPSNQGMKYLEQALDFTNTQRSKLMREHGFEQFQISPRTESELLKLGFSDGTASGLGQTFDSSDPVRPICGASCVDVTSGIDSKLQPLRGGSNQKLLQRSTVTSSSASFSDASLARSQERGSVATASGTLTEENFNTPQIMSSMSAEDTRLLKHGKISVMAENSVKNPHSVEFVNRLEVNGRKRKMLDAIESAELLHLGETDCVKRSIQDSLGAKHQKLPKKSKETCEEKVNLKFVIDESEKSGHDLNEFLDDTNACRQTLSPASHLTGKPFTCKNNLRDCFGYDHENVAGFKDLADGDYMKLLELDNPADEECFRRAMEMPMSPTLPLIANAEAFDLDNFEPLIEESFLGGMLIGKETPVPSHCIDVITTEINCNDEKHAVSGNFCNELLHEEDGPLNPLSVVDCRNGFHSAENAGKATNIRTEDYGFTFNTSIACKSDDEILDFAFKEKRGTTHNSIPEFCVIYSDIDDAESISRIFSATKACLSLCIVGTRTVSLVQTILLTLENEEKAFPREKACAFFTTFLLRFSAYMGKSGSLLNGDFVSCLDSFAADIQSVMSNVEARSLFAGVCCLDELLGLMEDFLINRRVMLYADESSEKLIACKSGLEVLLDGVNIRLSSKLASADQLVAGGIILGSICAAIENIGFLCATSFYLLQRHRQSTLVLNILHIFAYLGGDKFFSQVEYSLTMIVLKSIVMFQERENVPDASVSPDLWCNKCPFGKCPFLQGAVSPDDAVLIVVERLQYYTLSYQHQMELGHLSNSSGLHHKNMPIGSCEEDHSVDKDYEASCGLKKCLMLSLCSNSLSNETICDFIDCLSLLELLACNMKWKWTSDKLIPKMLEMLEIPKLGNLAVAVVIHLGQLGRLGVSTCGYENGGVEDLRCKLSTFLWRDGTIRSVLPVQMATLSALLGLLPLDFEKVIHSKLQPSVTVCQSVYVDLIRKWFCLLSKEQQFFSFSLLQSVAEDKY
ncbi:hypothetical protein K2173_000491 [Erythroxylum novogranatense]|uniref:Maternal effect embryo arrest 22 n=1 Tax=Erythroxylum novogranatense TaxID=1862640 RepID=A0AAV8SWG1_9ROSI|nr:hypothetical protein K2173_000491 [Erythroxylum novogranatense]